MDVILFAPQFYLEFHTLPVEWFTASNLIFISIYLDGNDQGQAGSSEDDDDYENDEYEEPHFVIGGQ